MDAFLAIVSKRDERRYADRPVSTETTRRILDAGRLAGSAANRQPWRFLAVVNPDLRRQMAENVYVPDNLLGAAMVVAVAVRGKGPVGLDAGRAIQNMMIAAWNDGVVSCPNGITESERMAELLGLEEDEQPVAVISFGYPVRPRDPERRSPEEWIERANRKPFDEVVKNI